MDLSQIDIEQALADDEIHHTDGMFDDIPEAARNPPPERGRKIDPKIGPHIFDRKRPPQERLLGDGRTIAPPLHFPIPEPTLRRCQAIQDAARLYIHMRCTSTHYLARVCNVADLTIQDAVRNDGWKEAAERQMAIAHGNGVLAPVVRRDEAGLLAIKGEIATQQAIAEQLQADRAKLMVDISAFKDKTSRKYRERLGTLKILTEMVERYIGKDIHDEEVKAMARARVDLRKKAAERGLESDVPLDDVIDMVDSEEMPEMPETRQLASGT